MGIYKLIRPFIFLADPESAHLRVAGRLKRLPGSFWFKRIQSFHDAPYPAVKIAGIEFKNPLGIAAGFDKNAEFHQGLSAFGMGFIELGSVTLHPQKGNPRPRIFRLPEDKAVINRMGLNNVGLEEFINNLKNHPPLVPIGVSIAPNNALSTEQMIEDMSYCTHKLAEYTDYISLNLSCPNQDGVTSLQEPETILELLNTLAIDKPIFCKFSSDLTQVELLACLEVLCGRVAGIILANTSVKREGLRSKNKQQKGGLSGKPLYEKVLEQVRWVREKYPQDFAIIFSGGVFSEKEAKRALEAGADLIQIYSGMIYEGPGIFKRILKKL